VAARDSRRLLHASGGPKRGATPKIASATPPSAA
jgi:hypothetical protein